MTAHEGARSFATRQAKRVPARENDRAGSLESNPRYDGAATIRDLVCWQQTGDKDALLRVLRALRYFVRNIARKYYRAADMEVDDMEQELIAHLIEKALPKFDPTKGYALSTYLTPTLNRTAYRLQCHKRLIYLSEHVCYDAYCAGESAALPTVVQELTEGDARSSATPDNERRARYHAWQHASTQDIAPSVLCSLEVQACLAGISPVNRQVAYWVAAGVPCDEIARRLGVTRQRINDRLNVLRNAMIRKGIADERGRF